MVTVFTCRGNYQIEAEADYFLSEVEYALTHATLVKAKLVNGDKIIFNPMQIVAVEEDTCE